MLHLPACLPLGPEEDASEESGKGTSRIAHGDPTQTSVKWAEGVGTVCLSVSPVTVRVNFSCEVSPSGKWKCAGQREPTKTSWDHCLLLLASSWQHATLAPHSGHIACH